MHMEQVCKQMKQWKWLDVIEYVGLYNIVLAI